LSQYLNHKPLAAKPTAHISYHEGITLIKRFLAYASQHPVEDLQRFTAQWVPHPSWVKKEEVVISEEHIARAAELLQEQLGHHGIERVGGKMWWQWRRPGSELKAEWIEMRSDYNARKKSGDPCKRVMLYVHGGAYFFGSVDEHRYQLQRHARKLNARVFARKFNLFG
jgi:acetyl esterase/lipase